MVARERRVRDVDGVVLKGVEGAALFAGRVVVRPDVVQDEGAGLVVGELHGTAEVGLPVAEPERAQEQRRRAAVGGDDEQAGSGTVDGGLPGALADHRDALGVGDGQGRGGGERVGVRTEDDPGRLVQVVRRLDGGAQRAIARRGVDAGRARAVGEGGVIGGVDRERRGRGLGEARGRSVLSDHLSLAIAYPGQGRRGECLRRGGPMGRERVVAGRGVGRRHGCEGGS